MEKEVPHRPQAEEKSENWAKWGDSSNTREGAGGDNQDWVMINWCNPCYNVKVGHNHAEDTNDDPDCDSYDDENMKEVDNDDRRIMMTAMTVMMTAMPVRRKVSLPGQFITTSCSYLTTWSSLDFRYLLLFWTHVRSFSSLTAMLKLRWFIWLCHIEILVVIYVDVDANIHFDDIADELSGGKRKDCLELRNGHVKKRECVT